MAVVLNIKKFPDINHIDDVLPAIKGKDEFIVAEREGYKIINYVVNKKDTFPEVKTIEDALLRECRGLTFYPDGRVMRRLFHKFFNLNERAENYISNVDFSKSHHVLVKLDGSMIAPLFINKEVKWGTKMGLTEIGSQVDEFVKDHQEYNDLALWFKDQEQTPIFEFCSRKNRVVLDYSEDDLVLLAIRDNLSGEYMPYESLCYVASTYNIPVVQEFQISNITDVNKFVEELKVMENVEGIVVTFQDGHRIKLKTDWYIKIHKAKDVLTKEYVLADLILSGKADDIKPCLMQEDLKFMTEFENKLLTKVSDCVKLLKNRPGFDRKEFALGAAQKIDPILKAMYFATWDDYSNENCNQVVLETFLKNCKHQKQYQEFKERML